MEWNMWLPNIWTSKNPQISRNYTAHDYPALLRDVGIENGAELYATVKDVPLFDPDIGVDVYCIHGSNNTTPFQFR